jgi:hypothetical protein
MTRQSRAQFMTDYLNSHLLPKTRHSPRISTAQEQRTSIKIPQTNAAAQALKIPRIDATFRLVDRLAKASQAQGAPVDNKLPVISDKDVASESKDISKTNEDSGSVVGGFSNNPPNSLHEDTADQQLAQDVVMQDEFVVQDEESRAQLAIQQELLDIAGKKYCDIFLLLIFLTLNIFRAKFFACVS